MPFAPEVDQYLEKKTAFGENNAYFRDKYGVVPEFKAGLRCGDVMAGEIGIVKR